MYEIIGSVVVYRNPLERVQETINSFLGTDLNVRLYVIDNSPDDRARRLCNESRVDYIFNGKNIGFGAAHNIALRVSMRTAAYHIVLNPDVYFKQGVLEKLLAFARARPDAGLVMPKILNPDGSIQYLCKQLPTPDDLILRRFLPEMFNPLVADRLSRYEMRNRDYTKVFSAPVLSGCFMMINCKALLRVGVFDERYFMYMEDVDLSRRIRQHFEAIYFPGTAVYHGYAKGSYRNMRLMIHHIVSALRYFQKWGWYSDGERTRINQQDCSEIVA